MSAAFVPSLFVCCKMSWGVPSSRSKQRVAQLPYSLTSLPEHMISLVAVLVTNSTIFKLTMYN